MTKPYLPLALAAGCLGSLCTIWLKAVNNVVSEPYMDEVFHIPQAQKYCEGDFRSWDPKLTTPPGLYGFSLLLKVLAFGGCEVPGLRSIGLITLAALLLLCYLLRSSLQRDQERAEKNGRGSSADCSNIVHAAFNICLFPPLFFFSGLYYTDVLSTFIVILTYYVFLQKNSSCSSIIINLAMYVFGLLALFMRQTNIFWVGVFLAGLGWVQTCKDISHQKPSKKSKFRQDSWIQRTIIPYTRGELHDPPLDQSSPLDLFWCLVSIGVSAISHPVLLLSRLWPHLALLISFASFVLWNGGVVLGDKSNHVATIHLPQMLYFWVFVSFFSFPLFYPTFLQLLDSALSIVRPATGKPIALFPRIGTIIWSLLACGIGLVIVNYNTIIHPFTLADNRHYMFYVFRYTILRHQLIKYALVPIYVFCMWLVFGTLAGMPPLERSAQQNSSLKAPKSNMKLKLPKIQAAVDIQKTHEAGTSASFVLIWLLATTLSLITAPLVEPRYFIIPWVIWRLNVPASRDPKTEKIRLWFETIWFLVINLVTCAIFLYHGFEWESEPGNIQRFMW